MPPRNCSGYDFTSMQKHRRDGQIGRLAFCENSSILALKHTIDLSELFISCIWSGWKLRLYRQNCCRGVYAYEISRHASPGTYREERRSNLICGNSIVKRREQRAANRQADIVFYNVLSRPGIKILRARCDTEAATTDLIPSLIFY